MTLSHIGYWAAVTIGLGCLFVVVVLVLVRLLADREERRRTELRTPLRRTVLALGAGEPQDQAEAARQLRELPQQARRAVEEDMFALVPKLRGEARQRVRDVLRDWRTTERARTLTSSVSRVRRARGYHRLGVLAFHERFDDVLAGLDDKDFTVRRTAMLALASFPVPYAVEQMLAVTTAEPRLRHDFLAAVDQIGDVAVKPLVARLAEPDTADPVRERILAAEALGLLGDLDAVPALERCLAAPDSDPELRIAALRGLGELGAPSSAPIVAEQLGHESPLVRRVAAVATGMIGGASSLLVLEIALGDENVEVARAAATALRRAGAPGMTILRTRTVPVAREALALESMRSGR